MITLSARLSRTAAATGLLVSVLLAGCTGSGTSSSAAKPASAPTTIAGYYAQKLSWHKCHGQFQCARLLVPFDYSRPDWRRFSLPIVRLPASDPSKRIGSLVMNPGGPGGSGVQYALAATSVVSPAVRARFDVVGFDPRGVADSIPAVRCMSDHQLDVYNAVDTPATPGQVAYAVSLARQFAAACKQNSGPMLPYVGTQYVARDMDVLRAALGDQKLTYIGKSYGTFLGTWYAQLFPTRVRALVLDGAVNPAESALTGDAIQAQGFEVALSSFAASCVRMANCPLGHGSVASAIAKVQDLINRATAHPLTSQIPGQPATASMIQSGIATALYSKAYWKYLSQALAQANTGDGTFFVELADLLAGRAPNGHYSNLIAANVAVNCVDRPYPHGLSSYENSAASSGKASPQFGAAIAWGSLPCAYWPVPPAAPVQFHATGAPPILVVGTLRDPATPYRDAQALAAELSSGVLLGWNGDGHTAYMEGSSCVDSAVDEYLINLVPPHSGTVCP